MDEARQQNLHTDAGGDYDEENAVCYLSIVLADEIAGFGSDRMLADMDMQVHASRLMLQEAARSTGPDGRFPDQMMAARVRVPVRQIVCIGIRIVKKSTGCYDEPPRVGAVAAGIPA